MTKNNPYCSSTGCDRKTRFAAYPYCSVCYRDSSNRYNISRRKKYTPTSRTPKKRMSLIEGEYRNFVNYYINGRQYTFGWPTSACADQRVWVGIDEREIERISESEAYRRIRSGRAINTTMNTVLTTSSSEERYGYCNRCSKKLRGNRAKSHCTECWYKYYK
jgi:hypothetical protein